MPRCNRQKTPLPSFPLRIELTYGFDDSVDSQATGFAKDLRRDDVVESSLVLFLVDEPAEEVSGLLQILCGIGVGERGGDVGVLCGLLHLTGGDGGGLLETLSSLGSLLADLY